MLIEKISSDQNCWDLAMQINNDYRVNDALVVMNAIDTFWKTSVEDATYSASATVMNELMDGDTHIIRGMLQDQVNPLMSELMANPVKQSELQHGAVVASILIDQEMGRSLSKALRHYSASTKQAIGNGGMVPPTVRICEGAVAGLMHKQLVEAVTKELINPHKGFGFGRILTSES
jgi:hypothetical protein